MVIARIRGRDRDAVRATWFLVPRRLPQRGGLGIAIETLQRTELHALDVAADAALAEAQGHPRFEAMEDARAHLRMTLQEEIQTVGPGQHQLLQPRGTAGVLLPEVFGPNEQPHAQVLDDGRT